MAFRIKSYQQIVDDVLTDLTGGVAGEEHTFLDGTDTYELSQSPVRASGVVSIRGTAGDTAHTFAGSDYYLAEDNILTWVGTRPDAGTAFYVNYYPDSASAPISDRNVGSVTRTVVEALGRELATLYAQMDKVYLSAYVDTAEGRSLEFVVSLLGIERILAGRAVGEAEFSRSTPATGDITIPLGTLVSDREDNRYETIEEATLRQGQLAVEVPIRAVSESIEPSATNTLTLMPRPVVGIEKVINYEATAKGTRHETDEELRARAKAALYGAGKATVEAIKFAVLEQGVNSVVIHDMPQGLPGELDVVVDYEGDEEAKQEDVKRAIDETRAAGIRVNLNPTSRVALFLEIQVVLTLDLLSDEERVLSRSIEQQIANYVNSLAAGETVLGKKIISPVMADPRVQDASYSARKGGWDQPLVPAGDIPMGEMEKATVQAIEVEFEVAPADAPPIEAPEGPSPIKVEVDVQGVELTDEFVSTVGDVDEAQDRATAILEAKVHAFLAERFAGDAIVLIDLQNALASDKYTLTGVQVRNLHVLDGLVVTLQQPDDTDRVRENEQIELTAVNVSFD